MSNMEGKTNFSKRLKQFDDLTRLIPPPLILRQIYAMRTGGYGEVYSVVNLVVQGFDDDVRR